MEKKFWLQTKNEKKEISLQVDEIFNVGYAGRNQEAVRKHVEELAEMGVAVPKHVPAIYPVASTCLCTDDFLEILHDKTSGEVEYVLFVSAGKQYITIGSDHSDRELETHNVQWAKQICSNMVAETVWDMHEVEDHLDSLVMRSFITKDGVRSIYQEGSLAELLAPEQQLEILEKYLGRKACNAVIYSGTLPTKDGVIYGDKFEFEMIDPVLNRKITGGYSLKRLPDPRD